VTFNQFHDILPGSAINEANKEAIARHTEVLRKATELRNNAFRKMADEVKFQSGIGQPVVAYNLQPFIRKAVVEATVYSHEEPATAKLESWGNYYDSKYVKPTGRGQNNVPSVLVRDASGKTYAAQVVWGKITPPGFTSKVQFIVDDMPAGGYRTFYVDLTKPGEYNESIPFKDNTFETDLYRIRFDMRTGGIVSLYDKRSKKEYVKEGGQLNKLRIYLEDKKGGMKSWTINNIVKEEDVKNIESVRVVENGPVRACVESVKTWGRSRFIERTYIYRSYPRIGYDI
jgi:alpha-mannosidase